MEEPKAQLHADMLRLHRKLTKPEASIRERQQSEQNLRKSMERYLTAMKETQVGLWDWDVETDEVYFSPGWKQLLGYTDHEIHSHNDEWSNRLHPKDFDRAWSNVDIHFKGLTPFYENEFRLHRKDGSWGWILSRGIAVREGSGTPHRLIGTHVDITNLKRSEERLKSSLQEREAVLQKLHHHTRYHMDLLSRLMKNRSDHVWNEEHHRVLMELQHRMTTTLTFLKRVGDDRQKLIQTELQELIPLKIHTLGRLEVTVHNRPVPDAVWLGRKSLLLLLALVTLGGRMVPKDVICDLLWPESDADKAITNFHTTLHRLHLVLDRALEEGPQALHLKSGLLSLDPTYCWCDCWAFEEAVRKVRQGEASGQWEYVRVYLEEALSLYLGEYLPQFPSEPWIEAKRQSIKEQFTYLQRLNSSLG